MEIEVKEEDVLDSLIIKEEPVIQEQSYHRNGDVYVFKEESIENFLRAEFPDEFAKFDDPNGFIQLEITEVDETPVQRVAVPRKPRITNKYNCSHCPEIFNKKWLLEMHMYIHLNMLILKCNKCGKAFKKAEQLRQHKKKCFVQQYKCLDCNDNFTSSCDSSGHVKSVGIFNNLPYISYMGHQKFFTNDQSSLFECTVCQKLFTSVKQLKTHKLAHLLKCPYCERSFKKLENAEMHISNDHRGLPLNPKKSAPKCTICKKRCKSFELLKKHVMMHNMEKVFQCGSCKNVFETVIDIEDHVVNVHEELTLPDGFPEVWTVYRCHRTGKTFPVLQRMLNNVEKLPAKNVPRVPTVPQLPGMEFQCPDCDETFMNQNLLDQHMLVDQPLFKRPQDQEKFQCRSCGVIHTSQMSLESHEKQHTLDERVNSLYLLLEKAKAATAASKTCQHSTSTSSVDPDYYVYIE